MNQQQLYELIEDIIKVHPDATDATKLQGSRHKELLKAIVDFTVALAGGDGEFAYDWTKPSTRFNGYTNSETTFKAGFKKFMNPDVAPVIASFYATNAVREKGSDRAVQLNYDVIPGNLAVTQIIVDSALYQNPTVFTGTANTGTVQNVDTSFGMSVQDAAGNVASTTTSVVWRDKRVYFTSSKDLTTATDAAISYEVRVAGGELSEDRYLAGDVACNNSRVYVAYPVAFGDASKIILNDFEDNSFTKIIFNHVNDSGYATNYILYSSENFLFGVNKIAIK